MKYDWELKYNCWQCGACCRAIKCRFLKDNKCTIYETRPKVCRIGFGKPPDMPAEEYLALTEKACHKLEALYPGEEDGV